MQNTMLNYGFEFKKLNDSRHDMGEFCEPSLWPELVPTERFLVSRHECWLASDLAKIVNVTDDEKYMDDISLCNAFYGATPKKFQPHNPNAMTELKKQHIYRLNNNDVELSRYACWTLLKDMESEIPTTFFQTYFLIPNATLQYLNQATDAMNRISLRQTVAKYQKQMAGIMKSFKVKQGKYYANLNNLVARWLFGNLKSNDIRDEYNIYQNKPLADYMNDKLLATYATALKKIIDIWDNDAPSHEYTTLYGIIYNEMTSARKNFQFGRPEDNFVFKLNKINKKKQPISVHDVEKWKKMRESEFTKKYITEKVR